MASRRHASQRSAWAGAAAIAAACLFTLSPLPAAAQSQTDLSQTDLARAYQTIASKTFVDLTHSFGPDTPVWSGSEVLAGRRSEDARALRHSERRLPHPHLLRDGRAIRHACRSAGALRRK